MTREEQIRKAAHSGDDNVHAEHYPIPGVADMFNGYFATCFELGARWADQHPNWISVEERLPEVGEKIIFYSPRIDDWLSGALQQDGRWWCEEYGTHFYDVTHWMEIVPPRKED